MALIKCPECGKEISDKAPTCIHCGYPLNLNQNLSTCYPSKDKEPSAANGSSAENGIVSVSALEKLEVLFCTKCGKENKAGSSFCGYCGTPFSPFANETSESDIDLAYYKANLKMQQQALLMQQQELEEMRRQTEQQKMQYDSMMKCPRCGSTSLSGSKKGYGVGKGVVGAAILGPFGLVAGNIGSKKVIVTCIKCGYKFKK